MPKHPSKRPPKPPDPAQLPACLEMRLLGQYELRLNGDRVEPEKPSRKADALVAYLQLGAGRNHERSELMDRFCTSVKDPASDFRGVLKRAREMAGKEATPQFYTIHNVNGESMVRLEHTDNLWVDALEFQKSFAHTPKIEDLMDKARLYCGPFMPGYEDVDAGVWVKSKRADLEHQFDVLMERLLDVLVGDGRWDDVVTWAEYWIAHSTLNHKAYENMLEAYSELSHLHNLDATYRRYTEALNDYGWEASEETQQKYEYLRKALLLRFGKKAGAAPQAAPEAPSNERQPKPLPEPPTQYIDRANDLALITARLADPDCRLLTLVGIGGVGKTRLALHAAQQLANQFPQGVCFVNFGQITSDELLLAALATALDFVPYGQEPLSNQLHNYLREKRLLLILDSFEHAFARWESSKSTESAESAIDATQLLEELLAAAPEIKVLVTSRERLRLASEYTLSVEGLDYPPEGWDGEGLENFGAVKLFMRTAKRVRREFDLNDEREGVVRICQQAEGLPLAIDLAAVHVAGMSAADIADAIEASLDVLAATGGFNPNEDPRHRSVRATFEYSWAMMTREEKEAFAQLSIFAGSFSREAARNVVNAPQRVLSGMVSNALLHYDFKAGRYDVHDLLRQFAGEKLRDAHQNDATQYAALAARMTDYYLSFARRNKTRYAELKPEWSNFLAAMRAAHAGARWQTVLECAEVLGDAWFTQARFYDARQGYAWATDAAMQLEDEPAIAHCLVQTGNLCIIQDDRTEAEDRLTRGLALFTELGEPKGIAAAQFHLARLAIERGRYAEAEARLTESARIREELNDLNGLAETLMQQARTHHRTGHYERAQALSQRALTLYQTFNNNLGSIQVLCLLTLIESDRGNQVLALECGQTALSKCREYGLEKEQAELLYVLTPVYRRNGNLNLSRQCGLDSLAMFKNTGNRMAQAHALLQLSITDEARGDLLAALQEGEHSQQISRELDDRVSMAYALVQVGDVHQVLKQTDLAIEAWSAAQCFADELQLTQLQTTLRERLRAKEE